MASSYLGEFDPDAEQAELSDVYIQERIQTLMRSQSRLKTDLVDTIRDVDWVKESMTATIQFDGYDKKTRFLSSADSQFEDASLGGNWAVNPLPQFTRYADPRSKGLLFGREDVEVAKSNPNLGMGMYYSEAFNDTKQVIHMRFGVPEFNSLLSFFTGFFDNDSARLANTGTILGNFTYMIGRAAGMVLNIIYWPLLAVHSIGAMYKFFAGKPATKYYYMRPTMNNYWTAVTTMLNQIAVYRRLLPINIDFQQVPTDSSTPIDSSVNDALKSFFPGIFGETGFIDVYKIANRAQKIRNHVNKTIDDATADMSWQERFVWAKQRGGKAWMSDPGEGESLIAATSRWFASAFGDAQKAKTGGDDGSESVLRSVRTPVFTGGQQGGGAADYSMPGTTSGGFLDGVSSALEAEFHDGASFATFRVDYAGPADESFSNSIAESDVSSKFNSVSAQARSASFSLAKGNVDGGVISSIFDGAKSFVEGALESFHMSGLLSLAGAAFVDIPKHWDNSSANMPKMNYSMQLVSPYGNAFSQLMNIHLPLCMLLAAALPRSTGSQSYTSPFLVELFDKGRAQTRLGIIDSLSITRGTTNLGFNKDKNFMSADVSFSVIDLSSIMHMPINSGMFNWTGINPVKALFGEDTPYSDYLHVLAGASFQQSVYKMNKLRDNALVYFRRLESLTSVDRWAGFIHDSPIGMLDAFVRGTERQ